MSADSLTRLILTGRGTLDPLQLRLAGGAVKRFHAEELRAQTVAEHSWRVAVILHALYPERDDLLRAALYHDVAEGITGDLPAMVKRYYPDIKMAVDEVTTAYESFLGLRFLNTMSREDKSRLKVCDYLELAATAAAQTGRDAQRVFRNAVSMTHEWAFKLPPIECSRVLGLLNTLTGEPEPCPKG